MKTGGSGKTISCAICHGDEFEGSRGSAQNRRSAAGIYSRQLIAVQNGTSAGTAAALMKKAVANLSEDDIISISASSGRCRSNAAVSWCGLWRDG